MMKSHTCGLIKTFSIIGSNPEFYLLCLRNFSPNVRINNKQFFSAAISGLTFMNLHFILLHNFDTLACVACAYFYSLYLACFCILLHLCLCVCNAACHPLRPSSLLDIGELGRHLALRPRREGWKNVRESHIVSGRVESFDSLQLRGINL